MRARFGVLSSTGGWAILFVMLNAIDVLLTLGIIGAGGQELNPVTKAMFRMGTPAGVALKVGASGLVALLLFRMRRRSMLRLSALLFFGVCLFNAAGLIAAKANLL